LLKEPRRFYGFVLDSISCQDTPNWHNGWSGAKCGKGLTCYQYATSGYYNGGTPWCKDGKVTSGSEWTLGAKYNYPEKNCCVCGKGTNGNQGGKGTNGNQGGKGTKGKQSYSF
jgi:hypothetical protein